VSETATAPIVAAPAAATLPLFFHNVVGVNPTQHGHLHLDRNAGFAFAAHAQAIPIGLGEFEVACHHYPIVFTTGPNPTPMVLLGLQEGSNLFVQPDGTWRIDTYIPAYCRAFPFIFVEDTEKKTMFVGMETGAKAISETEGPAMFEDGKPSPAMNETIAFCAAFRDSLNAGIAFGRELQNAGLLEEEEANIQFTKGGSARVTGFKLLKTEKLEKLDDTIFLNWRHRSFLPAIYAHLHSAGRWSRLVDLATAG
jgi:hypothetical protein